MMLLRINEDISIIETPACWQVICQGKVISENRHLEHAIKYVQETWAWDEVRMVVSFTTLLDSIYE